MNILENFVYYLKSLKKWYAILFLIAFNMGSYFMKFVVYQQLVEFIINIYGRPYIPINAVWIQLSRFFLNYLLIHVSYNVTYYYLEKNVVQYTQKVFGGVIDRMMNYQIEFFKHNTHSKINQLWFYMNNVEMVVEKLILELPRIGAFLIYYIYLLNSCSPHLLSMVGLTTVAAVYVLNPFSNKLRKLQDTRVDLDTETKNKLLETTTNIEFIKINNKQKHEAKKIKESYSIYLQNKLKDKQLSSILSIASDVSTDLLTFIIFAVGAINIMYGFIKPVELLYLVIHTGNFYYQIINLKDVFVSFNTVLPKLKVVYELISYDNIENIDQSTKPSENFISCEDIVVFDDVVFGYNGSKKILNNANFVFKRNRINLLLGPNGSGKSTIIKLLFRLYELDQGTIMLYGADIRNLSLRELRNNITLVSKDPAIFDGTVWDNLVYGCESIDKNYVYEICDLLESNNWLDKNKYKDVGFRGNKLTGGEKKKIQIINAVCRSGHVVVFDEPSNALDSNAIKWFIDFVNKLRTSYGKTIIIASHDLRLVDAADHVVEI